MKKLTLTIAFLLGLATTVLADPNGGGLFQRGTSPEMEGMYGNRSTNTPMLPSHGSSENQNANELPLGSGIALLLGLGGAYLLGKKHRQE